MSEALSRASVTAQIEAPERLRLTINMTMTLNDWARLVSLFGNKAYEWPASEIVKKVREVTRSAETQFIARPSTGEEQ